MRLFFKVFLIVCSDASSAPPFNGSVVNVPVQSE